MPTIKELEIIADLGQVDLTAVIDTLHLSATIDALDLIAVISPSYIIGVWNPYTGKDRHRTIQTNIDAFDFTKFLVSQSRVNNYVVPVVDVKNLSMNSIIPAPSVGTVIT